MVVSGEKSPPQCNAALLFIRTSNLLLSIWRPQYVHSGEGSISYTYLDSTHHQAENSTNILISMASWCLTAHGTRIVATWRIPYLIKAERYYSHSSPNFSCVHTLRRVDLISDIIFSLLSRIKAQLNSIADSFHQKIKFHELINWTFDLDLYGRMPVNQSLGKKKTYRNQEKQMKSGRCGCLSSYLTKSSSPT